MSPLILLCICATAIGVAACQQKTEQSGSPTGNTGGSAPQAGASDSITCPFPKRCIQSCKDAFWKATNACSKENDAMIKAMGGTTADAFGKCNAACVTHQDQCIGSASVAECRCVEDCERNLPPAVRATLDGYKRCTASAAAACE